MDFLLSRKLLGLGIPSAGLLVMIVLSRRFSFQSSPLGPTGSGIIAAVLLISVTIVTLYTLYLYSVQQTNQMKPIVDPARKEIPISSAPLPFAVFKGQYRPSMYTKWDRNFMVFGCIFLIAWCSLTFFVFEKFVIATASWSAIDMLVHLFISTVMIYALFLGVTMLHKQLVPLFGKVSVYVSSSMVLISRSLSKTPFSDHIIILADEWKFDGKMLVSKIDGKKVAIPDLPEDPRSELINVLNSFWR